MSIGIPVLWPAEVAFTDVVSPLMILRHQAGLLRSRSQNVLEAEVKSRQEDGAVLHEFSIVVPALSRKSYSMFTVKHQIDEVYPAGIQFGPLTQDGFNDFPNQEAFTHFLAEVFRHPRTVSVIQSQLAQINERAELSKN